MGRIAETINANPKSGRIYTCKIASLCEDDDDIAAIDAMMTNAGLSCRAIARAIGNVSEGTVFKHRSKDCKCYKKRAA